MPTSVNSPKVLKKKPLAKKPLKVARLKPSAILATKVKTKLEVIRLLKKHYPDAHCALHFSNPFELTVATILSAQCTDERVNIVTKTLFKELPTPEKMANAPVEKIEEIVRSTGFFKNKAKNLKSMAQSLVSDHGSEVPKDLEALVQLAGVGRKTANVVLGNAFGIVSGIVVDTHVTRLSNRLGWTKSQDAVQIEKDLQQFVPRADWIMLSHWLIWHGRKICMARNPQCEACFLNHLCPQKGVVLKNKIR